MDLALGILFAASAICMIGAHIVLLVHVARTRRLSVFLAALFLPPVAPLTCAEGKRAPFASAWFIALLVYSAALVVSRYTR